MLVLFLVMHDAAAAAAAADDGDDDDEHVTIQATQRQINVILARCTTAKPIRPGIYQSNQASIM